MANEQLENETLKLARKLCTSSAEVLALGKAAFYEQISKPRLADSYEVANNAMVHNLGEVQDAREGLGAFLGKRAPTWAHKSSK